MAQVRRPSGWGRPLCYAVSRRAANRWCLACRHSRRSSLPAVCPPRPWTLTKCSPCAVPPTQLAVRCPSADHATRPAMPESAAARFGAPSATPVWVQAWPARDAMSSISDRILSLLGNQSIVDLSPLDLPLHRHQWILSLHLVCLSIDGNLFDACWLVWPVVLSSCAASVLSSRLESSLA